MKRLIIFCLLTLVLLPVFSCENNNQAQWATPDLDTASTTYPSPTPVILPETYPLDDYTKIDQTAFEAYEIAAPYVALNWNPSATLYSIPNTAVMEMNLGYPKTGLGWFFMFKVPENSLEYYVYVDQGVVQGYTEAQPITISEDDFQLLALPPLEQLLDSDKIFDVFSKNGGKEYLIAHPEAKIVMELFYHKDNSVPIWQLHDIRIEDLENDVVFTVDASTGIPFQQ